MIAFQWVKNDDSDNKTYVDHISKHQNDNHLNNLRCVTPTENNRKKLSNKGIQYKYFDDIPDEAFIIDTYGTRNV